MIMAIEDAFDSTADDSLRFCQMFEGELLLEPMLRYWHHPPAEDSEYRNDLMENATEVMQASIHGERRLEDLPPPQMNLVAAVWYAEWAGLRNASRDVSEAEFQQRDAWLLALRRSAPSCFCDPNDLIG